MQVKDEVIKYVKLKVNNVFFCSSLKYFVAWYSCDM
jgi:hypothetical protein